MRRTSVELIRMLAVLSTLALSVAIPVLLVQSGALEAVFGGVSLLRPDEAERIDAPTSGPASPDRSARESSPSIRPGSERPAVVPARSGRVRGSRDGSSRARPSVPETGTARRTGLPRPSQPTARPQPRPSPSQPAAPSAPAPAPAPAAPAPSSPAVTPVPTPSGILPPGVTVPPIPPRPGEPFAPPVAPIAPPGLSPSDAVEVAGDTIHSTTRATGEAVTKTVDATTTVDDDVLTSTLGG